MTIDTLAYAKELEAAGVQRQAAEAHAEALTHHVLPDLVTKADLAATKSDLEHAIKLAIVESEHRLTVRVFGMVLGVVGVLNAILFALLRVVH
jgi:hypothetical protein